MIRTWSAATQRLDTALVSDLASTPSRPWAHGRCCSVGSAELGYAVLLSLAANACGTAASSGATKECPRASRQPFTASMMLREASVEASAWRRESTPPWSPGSMLRWTPKWSPNGSSTAATWPPDRCHLEARAKPLCSLRRVTESATEFVPGSVPEALEPSHAVAATTLTDRSLASSISEPAATVALSIPRVRKLWRTALAHSAISAQDSARVSNLDGALHADGA
ncbi:hypothetical protein ABMA10_21895 [Plantibacter sp. RU18]